MSGAERSAAPPIRHRFRSLGLSLGAAIVLAGGTLAGCGHAGADHPVTASSSATLTRPAAEPPADAVRSLDDEGPVQVVRGLRSVVISNTASGVDAHDLAQRVDEAVPVASGFWRTSWPQPVVVLVPASLAYWQELTGLPPDPDVAAVSIGATSARTAETSQLPPAGGGQRIVVDPVAYRRLSDAGRSVVLRHEVEHLLSATHTPPGMPTWLVEGTADVIGFTGSQIPVPQAAEELAALLRRRGPPASLPSDADFAGGSSSVAYEEGWLACRLIDRDRGARALRSFYDGVAAGIRAHRGSIAAERLTSLVSEALHQTTGWSLLELVARWRADLQHELGSAA